jgi:hypothetical protein
MRSYKAGLALAVIGSMLIAPLAAAGRRQDGIISGSAEAEAKQPYSQYVMRARDTSTNLVGATTTLDAAGKFALSGLTAGSFMVELVKGATPGGQGGKVVCTAGPFTLQDANSQVADLMIKKGANVRCNRKVGGLALLGVAALVGTTAGIVASGDDPAPPPPAAAPLSITPTAVSGAQ